MNRQNNESGKTLVVCLDNPSQHQGPTRVVTKVHEVIRVSAINAGAEFEVVKDTYSADRILSQRRVHLLIIHHANYSDVASLRKKHPNVKYVGTSSFLMGSKDCPPQSMAAEFRETLGKHYDLLLDDWGQGVFDLIENYRAGKLGNVRAS